MQREVSTTKRIRLSQADQIAMVTRNWRSLAQISRPCREAQVAALKQHSRALELIKSPSDWVQKEAKKYQHITKTNLIQSRGWTTTMISRFLGGPDQYGTSRCGHYDTSLYNVARIEKAEKSAAYLAFKSIKINREAIIAAMAPEQLAKRAERLEKQRVARAAARAAREAEEQREAYREREEWRYSVALTPTAARDAGLRLLMSSPIPMEQLYREGIANYEREHCKAVSYPVPREVANRWALNYIRHRCSTYDAVRNHTIDEARALRYEYGRGADDEEQEIIDGAWGAVNNMAMEMFPDLANDGGEPLDFTPANALETVH